MPSKKAPHNKAEIDKKTLNMLVDDFIEENKGVYQLKSKETVDKIGGEVLQNYNHLRHRTRVKAAIGNYLERGEQSSAQHESNGQKTMIKQKAETFEKYASPVPTSQTSPTGPQTQSSSKYSSESSLQKVRKSTISYQSVNLSITIFLILYYALQDVVIANHVKN